MEKKFKRLKIFDYILVSIFDFLLISLALSLFLIQLYSIKGIIGPIVIAILLIITAFLRGKLSKDFKEKILSNLLSDRFLNTTYEKNVLDNSIIYESKILDNRNLNIKSEDLIKGSYHSISFQSFDSVIIKTIGKSFEKENITIFQGRIIFIDYIPSIKAIIREKKEEALYGEIDEFSSIKTNNDAFDNLFTLYGNFLSINDINTIMELNESFNGEFCVSFTEKGIYLFKSDFFNGFEIDDTTSIDLIRKEFENEMAFIIKAIRRFCNID